MYRASDENARAKHEEHESSRDYETSTVESRFSILPLTNKFLEKNSAQVPSFRDIRPYPKIN